MKTSGINEFLGLIRKCQNDGSNYSGGHEQHCQKQEPAAEEDGGKEAILALTESVAQDPDEPQESNSSERHYVDRQGDGIGTSSEPSSRLQRVRRQRNPKQSKGDYQQHRKNNPSGGGGLWCF